MNLPPGGESRPLPTRPFDRDDDLLAAVRADGLARVRVIRWGEVAVVIGRGGRQNLELEAAAITADRVTLLQRAGGGCSVVLDPGNLVVSAALALPGIGGITSGFAALSAWLVAGLQRCGIPGVKQRGVSDLTIGDRKIGGSCIYRARGLLYYSATLLVDPQLELMERYLSHPPREPEYRKRRGHRDFVGSLRMADPDLEIGDLQVRLARILGDPLPRVADWPHIQD